MARAKDHPRFRVGVVRVLRRAEKLLATCTAA